MIRVLFRLFRQGVYDLALNPLALLFTLTAISLMVFLAGLFLMGLVTINKQLETSRGETAFQVYWKTGYSLEEIREQWRELHNLPNFVQVKTYTPEQALIELGRKIDKGSDLQSFPLVAKSNPLPATALVYFAPEDVVDIESWIRETQGYLRNMTGVSKVVATPLRDELGQAWRKMSRFIMWPSIVFLTLVMGLVVGNTVRLNMLNRANEVEILQMIGAYPWYIRFPMMVNGGLQGLIGGAIALVMLALIHTQLRDALNFPPLMMEVQFLPMGICLSLVLVPTFMGMLASWLAVREQ